MWYLFPKVNWIVPLSTAIVNGGGEGSTNKALVLPSPPPFTMAVDGLKFDRCDLGVDRDYHCCHMILDSSQ